MQLPTGKTWGSASAVGQGPTCPVFAHDIKAAKLSLGSNQMFCYHASTKKNWSKIPVEQCTHGCRQQDNMMLSCTTFHAEKRFKHKVLMLKIFTVSYSVLRSWFLRQGIAQALKETPRQCIQRDTLRAPGRGLLLSVRALTRCISDDGNKNCGMLVRSLRFGFASLPFGHPLMTCFLLPAGEKGRAWKTELCLSSCSANGNSTRISMCSTHRPLHLFMIPEESLYFNQYRQKFWAQTKIGRFFSEGGSRTLVKATPWSGIPL